jgi:hypothetical protein
VRAFSLLHALQIGQQLSESSGTSNTPSSSVFDILLLLHLILLVSWVVGLVERALLVHAIFLDLILFVGQLTSSLLSHNPPQRSSI